MKTATLTIEVPDDFEKGNGWNCPYSRDIAIGGSNFTEMIEATRRCHLTTNHCNADNCPVEIQEKAKPICNDCILSDVCSNYRKDGKCSRSF